MNPILVLQNKKRWNQYGGNKKKLIFNSEVYRVPDYESDIRLTKLKMSDPKWWAKVSSLSD